jgi:CxxC motif-containing protein (DUF1111 family)
MRIPQVASCLALAACVSDADPASSVQAEPARPLDGLDASHRSRFLAGLEEFSEQDTVQEGLGPLFNGSSCGHCHNQGGVGGGGTATVLRVGCITDDGFRAPAGGTLIFAFSIRPDIASATIPPDCEVTTRRRTTPLFGAGLIEAIPDESIVAVAAEQAASADGPHGMVAWVTDIASAARRVGRFGWKAQHATLDAFAAEAYRNEIGITNELFPDDNAPNGDLELLAAMDWVPDPEATVGVIGQLADFMRFLAAPEIGAGDHAAGAALFAATGCAVCHRPSFTTALDAGHGRAGLTVLLYSDLLLHDVGTGDGIPQGAAGARQLRTPPLWGLRTASTFLHDGRTSSLEAAIIAHAGEARDAQTRYLALDAGQRASLLAFLRSR